ncbi:acetoin utilization protein AcuB [Oceanotoga teriensis]|jgi:acetoin utilization protein AcuB|uniref:Acetoin utilization protein AcuB n=1 Tax=Oceanotoga teriensis TaxID=515440 RepID=A0AA45C4N4_9BACT|nr:CBS domain-containing protein [Oceanotoga teriensis]PWJ86819.1 acetoin utilization protein AcuB [Oceanotoga teriensis]
MYVRKWYSKSFHYVYLNSTLREFYEKLSDLGDNIAILRNDNTLYNMITKEELEFLSKFDENMKLYEILDPVEYFLFDDDLVEDALNIMLENHIKVLPVVDSEMIPLGIFGFFEILRAFRSISAMDESGTKIILTRKDKPGQLNNILQLLAKEDINVLSLMTSKNVNSKRSITLKLDIQNVNIVSDIFEKNNIEYDAIFEENIDYI